MNKAYELFEGIVTNYGLPRDNEMIVQLFEILEAQGDPSKPEVTEAGIGILEFMQNSETSNLKAKDIAEGMDISSRKVSGSIRKLVTDGFVEKFGKSPVIYSLTEKGKNFDTIAYKNKMNEGE